MIPGECETKSPVEVGEADAVAGERIRQMDAADRKAFPRASRVVRIGDAAWTSGDDDHLRQLSEVLQRRAREWQPCGVGALVEPPPRVRCGDSHVYLLYGPRVIWVDAANEIQVDIHGLVFEKRSRKPIGKGI